MFTLKGHSAMDSLYTFRSYVIEFQWGMSERTIIKGWNIPMNPRFHSAGVVRNMGLTRKTAC